MKFDAVAKDFNDLRAFKAQDDLRRAAVPGKPDDYKLALPQTFDLPKGADGKPVDFKFDDADPRLPAAREWAHKRGLDQAAFSELLAIQVQADLADHKLIEDGRKQEQAKLGVNGPQRIDAMGTWLKSMLGADRGEALLNRMTLAADFEAMEALIGKFSSQGSGQFSQQHRESSNDGVWNEDDYLKSGPPGSTGRAAYAAKHAPKQQQTH